LALTALLVVLVVLVLLSRRGSEPDRRSEGAVGPSVQGDPVFMRRLAGSVADRALEPGPVQHPQTSAVGRPIEQGAFFAAIGVASPQILTRRLSST
jgi:hypothetical protein